MAAVTDRRSVLALIGAAGAALPFPVLARSAPQGAPVPWLASPEQLLCERMLLQLIEDPQVKAIQAQLRAELAASPRAQLPDAAANLDRAIAQWTNSLIFAELIDRPAQPMFLWGTDDTPRQWLGHSLGGVGTSGDNPDAIYRVAGIEGGGRYEILGQYHPEGPPTQLLIEVDKGNKAKPANVMPTAGGSHADIHSSSMISDREIKVEPDGSFRITLGGKPGTANHLSLPPDGYCMVGARDILADWAQRPARLTIRRLDKPARPAPVWSLGSVRQKVHADLAGYIRFWANFPNIWFGGIKPNQHSAPMARPGGWGYVAGLNFSLVADEALLVTTTHGGARYTGFQINDPWMIAPDARSRQVCLNISQTTPSADGPHSDGSASYVISAEDTGIANWLDTCGMRDGIGIMRWQQIPPDLKADGLIRDFRVVKLAELAAMDLPRVTEAQRRERVVARRAAYETRVR